MEPDYMGVNEAANKCGIPPRTVRYMCAKGEWSKHAYRVKNGNRIEWRIPIAEVQKWIVDHPVTEVDSTAHLPAKVDETQVGQTVTAEMFAELIRQFAGNMAVLREELQAEREAAADREETLRKELAERDRQLLEAIKQNRFRWPWQK